VLALLPAVLLVLAAGGYAMKRTPTYTAQAKLTLGQLDVAAQAPSYVTAAQGLAATYSQAIHTGEVTRPAGKALHITPLEASKRLVASPIWQTPLFLVDATGPNERDAVKLANAASRALVRYVDGLNASAAGVGSALQSFKRASVDQHRAAAAVQDAQAAYGPNRSFRNRQALTQAQQRFDSAQLRVNVLASVYGNAKRVGATSNVLQILATADTATNDRSSVAQKVVFVAAVAGLAIGVAFAVRAATREPRAEEPAQRVKAAPAA
jgi:capsular polysaccharide biosynthesis protein